jgi:hypothetical protein
MNTKIKFLRSVTFTILLVVGLILSLSCTHNPTKPNNITPPPFKGQGLWIGGFIFRNNMDTVGYLNAFVMIAPDGQTFILNLSPEFPEYHLIAHGTLKEAESDIVGSLIIHDSTGSKRGFLNISQGKISTTTVEGKQFYNLVTYFNGTDVPVKGSGQLSLTRMDSMYNLPPSLTTISGHWTFVEEGGTTFLDINQNGTLTGGNSGGAQFSGYIKLIHADKNLYEIDTFEVRNCGAPWDGKYQGLATITEGTLNWAVVKEDDSFGFFTIFSQ